MVNQMRCQENGPLRLVDFIEQSNDALCPDRLYGLLERVLLTECGYDRVVFSLMSDHRSLKLRAGHGIMRNYPDDWMKHYIENGYEHFDPVRRFGFRHVGPFVWDALPLVMDLAPKQRLCLDQGREAGLPGRRGDLPARGDGRVRRGRRRQRDEMGQCDGKRR